MSRRPPRSTRTDTHVPDTTLLRSRAERGIQEDPRRDWHGTQRSHAGSGAQSFVRYTRRMHTPAADNCVAILTPDPADGTYADAWPEALDRRAHALAGADVAPAPIAWYATVDTRSWLEDSRHALPLSVRGPSTRRICRGRVTSARA